MRSATIALALAGLATLMGPFASYAQENDPSIQLGPRPFFLVDNMDDGELKDALNQCKSGPFYRTNFSIAHRGAPLQFPEHTREAYLAGLRMGAGIMECDVTFTADRQLVCRHSQCDLHTTTDILLIPDLAAKCSVPFTAANGDQPATATCCTSDITLADYRRLRGKMDSFNPRATTVEEFQGGIASYRTNLYGATGTLLTHAESIRLFDEAGAGFTPELKEPSVAMPFDGDYTQDAYAQQLIDEYKEAGIDPSRVYPQSFNLRDVLYWIASEPAFGNQAVFLDDRDSESTFNHMDPATWTPSMPELAAQGVKIIAPPMWMLVTLVEGKIVPSAYAIAAKEAGLQIITWSLERSGDLTDGGGYYFQSITDAINNSGDTYALVHALAQDVGVIGIFSDWPATVSYYASCMGLQ